MKKKKPTLTELRAMSNEDFEQYVKAEYKIWKQFVTHEDDYMSYDEFYREVTGLVERQN